MIRIGNAVNRYLGLEEKVHLHVADFNTFTPKQPYDVIFTLASYKTTDSGIENTIYDHLAQLHRWLAPQGIVVFESHHLGAETKDRLSPEQLGPVDRLYSWDDSHTIENGTREIFIFRKHAV
jgi:hypothetical protein